MLDKIILNALGNRALAERAARKYGVGSHAEAAPPIAQRSFRKVVLFPFALLIAIWHCIVLSANLAFLFLVYLWVLDPRNYEKYRPAWRRLADHWARYPSAFIYKATEAALYQDHCPADVGRALEVGVYTGETSRALFTDRRLLAGLEYNVDRLLIYRLGEVVHAKLYSADVRNLPFLEGQFSDVYCVHSIDDMELPAEEALREMARVVVPDGGVFFSGITRNFTRHNLLIRLFEAVGFKSAADFVFRNVYIGAFNHLNKTEWTAVLEGCGLELVEYRTYVPFWYAGIFDLNYRPETVLLNLCGWSNWLSALARCNWFRELLYRCASAMAYLSERAQGRAEGINFFIVAKRRKPMSGPVDSNAAAREIPLRCLRCSTSPLVATTREGGKEEVLRCTACDSVYPTVEGIPILLALD